MEIIINIPEEIKRRFDYEYYVDGEISKYTTDTILQIITDGFIKLNELKQKQEPKTGHWVFDEILDKHYYCSECKSMGVDYWDYCPNCGAKMQEVEE